MKRNRRDVRILDDFARQKRTDKFVESLDRDNFQGDREDVLAQMYEQLDKERAMRAAERKGRSVKDSAACKFSCV